MGGKCKFNTDWPKNYKWVEAVKDDEHKAKCTWCDSTFKIDSRGEATLKTHEGIDKHVEAAKARSMSNVLTKFFPGTFCFIKCLLNVISFYCVNGF